MHINMSSEHVVICHLTWCAWQRPEQVNAKFRCMSVAVLGMERRAVKFSSGAAEVLAQQCAKRVISLELYFTR